MYIVVIPVITVVLHPGQGCQRLYTISPLTLDHKSLITASELKHVKLK